MKDLVSTVGHPYRNQVHLTGVHVPLRRDHVGERVVVRRVIPGEVGPSGGPAMTDVLGTLVSWEDDLIRVQHHDGSTIDISRADIVAAKPVPPRAQPRS